MKELFEQILKDKSYEWIGICMAIEHSKFSASIKNNALIFFKKHKPKIWSKFFWNKYYSGNNYWWIRGPKGNEQRELFLKHLIKKLK